MFKFEAQFPALGNTFGLWSDDTSWSNLFTPNSPLAFAVPESAIAEDFDQMSSSTEHIADEIFCPFLDQLGDTVLEKNHPLRLYDVLPASIDRATLQNLDSWLLTGDSTPIQTSSVPDTKLYYPEPFVASPSFVHEEI